MVFVGKKSTTESVTSSRVQRVASMTLPCLMTQSYANGSRKQRCAAQFFFSAPFKCQTQHSQQFGERFVRFCPSFGCLLVSYVTLAISYGAAVLGRFVHVFCRFFTAPDLQGIYVVSSHTLLIRTAPRLDDKQLQ